MHAHVYTGVCPLTVPADETSSRSGVTTIVSAGDAGAHTIEGFRHLVVNASRTRVLAFVHISTIGLAGWPEGEAVDLAYLDVEKAVRAAIENADIVDRDQGPRAGDHRRRERARAGAPCGRRRRASRAAGDGAHRRRTRAARRDLRHPAARRHRHALLHAGRERPRRGQPADRGGRSRRGRRESSSTPGTASAASTTRRPRSRSRPASGPTRSRPTSTASARAARSATWRPRCRSSSTSACRSTR